MCIIDVQLFLIHSIEMTKYFQQTTHQNRPSGASQYCCIAACTCDRVLGSIQKMAMELPNTAAKVRGLSQNLKRGKNMSHF